MRPSPVGRWVLIGAIGLATLLAGMLFDAWADAFWRRAPASGWLWWWGRAAYWAGLGWLQIGLCLALAGAGWLLKRRQWLASALGGVWAVAVAGLSAQVLKHLAGRPRPHLNQDWWTITGPGWQSEMHSFPSGHAATSFALAVVLAQRFPRAWPLWYGGAAFIALGRVVDRSHFPLDIMAGALLGAGVGWLVAGRLRAKEKAAP